MTRFRHSALRKRTGFTQPRSSTSILLAVATGHASNYLSLIAVFNVKRVLNVAKKMNPQTSIGGVFEYPD